MNVLKVEPISAAQARELLEKRKKDGELNYEQETALEHCEKTISLTSKKAEEKVNLLLEKNKKLLPETAIKLVDIQPKSASTLKAILLKDKIELSEEEVSELMKLLG